MNLIRIFIIASAVAGCATSGIYDRQSWATQPKAQAEAECYNYINSAAGRGSNLYLCMSSKGWVER